MKKKEIYLYKVFLSARLNPLEIKMNVFKACGTEREDSYLIKAMDLDGKDKMENLPHNKIIPKSKIMATSGYTNPDSAQCGVWCFEEQISEAKKLCMDDMHSSIKINLDEATRMSNEFQKYQHESK